MSPALLLGFALGLRHGTDPDHLAAIDGLTRLRPKPTNGIYFAIGHGLIVTLLAVGIGKILAERFAFLGPWILIAVGTANLWRLLRPSRAVAPSRPIVVQPLLLGMVLAAGFETSSQLSALILAGETKAWLLGIVFSLGMIAVDGIDGLLAAATQNSADRGQQRAATASRILGGIVVLLSFALGAAELAGIDLDRVALPTGLLLFAVVVGIRIWARASTPVHRSVVCVSQVPADIA